LITLESMPSADRSKYTSWDRTDFSLVALLVVPTVRPVGPNAIVPQTPIYQPALCSRDALVRRGTWRMVAGVIVVLALIALVVLLAAGSLWRMAGLVVLVVVSIGRLGGRWAAIWPRRPPILTRLRHRSPRPVDRYPVDVSPIR
jgi:hypothetical protein